ncbi:aldose epimerase family protein [Roseobacter sp. S98]|uniref:aldose epimerase family protein n=1 Tax=Roseobacter algicola (ex Choi et al. 2025) (nom. illeg.) TaxID=3092138 RepID=UPI0035C6A1C5
MIFLHNDSLRVQVFPVGATLAGLWLRGTAAHSLVLGTENGAGYDNELTYAGAVVGPVANRLRNARAKLDRQILTLPANDGNHTLHGGPDGLHRDMWEVSDQTTDTVTLHTKRAQGEGGLPGNRTFQVQYALNDPMCLNVILSATTDADTLINLAHHPYWNLDDSEDVSGHTLKVHATEYLPTDADTLPNGVRVPVAGSPYDFRKPRPIPVSQSLDASICLSENRRDSPVTAAVLTGSTGVSMTIDTTEPGLQIYNGSGLPLSSLTLHDGRTLAPFAGVALEPQGWPDAPNHPDFPSIVLRRGQQYRQITRYRFSV